MSEKIINSKEKSSLNESDISENFVQTKDVLKNEKKFSRFSMFQWFRKCCSVVKDKAQEIWKKKLFFFGPRRTIKKIQGQVEKISKQVNKISGLIDKVMKNYEYWISGAMKITEKKKQFVLNEIERQKGQVCLLYEQILILEENFITIEGLKEKLRNLEEQIQKFEKVLSASEEAREKTEFMGETKKSQQTCQSKTEIVSENEDPDKTVVLDKQGDSSGNFVNAKKPLRDEDLPPMRKIEKQAIKKDWSEVIKRAVGILFRAEKVLGKGGFGVTVKLRNIINDVNHPFFDPNHSRFTDPNHPDYIGKVVIGNEVITREVTDKLIFETIEKEKELLRNIKRPVFCAEAGKTDEVPAVENLVLKVSIKPDKDHIARMYQEGKIIQKLSHPNIAKLYHLSWEMDVSECKSEEDDADFNFMHLLEYIDGHDMSEFVKKDNPRVSSQSDILKYIAQVCDGLSHAHAKGVIHRDIKPENIMIAKGGQAKIIDFGLAKTDFITEEERNKFKNLGVALPEEIEGVTSGTVRYMPPEQIEGKIDMIDARSDIYALGATLYHLITGIPPFTGNNPYQIIHKAMNKNPVSPKQINQNIPDELNDLVLQMLEKEQNKRPSGMYEVKQRILGIMEKYHGIENFVDMQSSISMDKSAENIATAKTVITEEMKEKSF